MKTKDKIVVMENGIKYTIKSDMKVHYIPAFEKRADEAVEFLKKIGFPKEFLKKK